MSTRRILSPHDHTPTHSLTAANLKNIETRRKWLIEQHRIQSNNLGPHLTQGELGKMLWNRELMFAKVALVSRGRWLLQFWGSIETERLIPPEILAWEADFDALKSAKFTEKFYQTRHTEAQTTAPNHRWVFLANDPIGSLKEVTEQEALRFYLHTGGRLGSHLHISTAPRSAIVVAGTNTAARTNAPSGGIAPYSYKLTNSPPAWATVASLTGIVTLRPPADLEAGDYVIWIEVKDANETSSRTTLTVTVTEPSSD